MKYIKLKTNRAVSAPFIAYLLSLLFILFLLGQTAFHTVQDAEWSHSLACAWQDLLAYARQKNYLAYAAIRIFPWLLVLWAALFVWERVNGWRTARKTNPITFLKFEKTGVLLGHQKARADVRLPYAETDLSVTVPVMVAYNKYGHPIHLFGLIEISFSYENKTYSVQHRGKLPFCKHCWMKEKNSAPVRLPSAGSTTQNPPGRTSWILFISWKNNWKTTAATGCCCRSIPSPGHFW